MHTGYDNFWIHNNSRHKPVLNLTKIDNCSHAQLTDNYKHMQSGGCPSSLIGFIQPQNSAASSHENDQYRKSHDQSLWPPSFYLLPFTSSHPTNFYSQEILTAPVSNFVYSAANSKIQENCDFRLLENPNSSATADAPPSYHTNSNYHVSAQDQINKNINAQIPRIRVKDVFSLNNSTMPNQLEADDSLLQTQQKERPQGQSLNFTSDLHNTSVGSQTQEEYTNFEKYILKETNKAPEYKLPAAKQSHLKNLPYTAPFQQKSAEFTTKDFEFARSRQEEYGSSLEMFERSTPNSLLRKLLNHENFLDAEIQSSHKNIVNSNNTSNALHGQGGIKISQKTNLSVLNNLLTDNSATDSGSNELNERLFQDYSNPENGPRVYDKLQENTSKTNEVNLGGQNFASNAPTKTALSATANGSQSNEINNQQNCLIKISIPHTGQSSFINLNDCGATEESSPLNVRNLLYINDELCGLKRKTSDYKGLSKKQNEVWSSLSPQVEQRRASTTSADFFTGSFVNDLDSDVLENCDVAVQGCATSPPRNLDTPNQEHQQNPFPVLSNAESTFHQNSPATPENVRQDLSTRILSENENIPKQEITFNDVIFPSSTLKQENCGARTESGDQQCSQNIPGEKVLNWTIKTEERSENLAVSEQELEKQSSENSKTLASDIKARVEEFLSTTTRECPQPEFVSTTISENCLHQKQTSKNNSSKNGEVPRPDKENEIQEVAEERELDIPKRSYKSNINRDKLDLLIQFLKKDEECSRVNASEEKDKDFSKTSNRGGKGRKEVSSNRNRRKLSKTCVVKNKNNSREMISLMSLKSPSCTSKSSLITKSTKEVEKTEKRKSVCANDGLKFDASVDVSKKPVKCNNHCLENETKNSLPETCNESAFFSRDVEESSEELSPESDSQEEKTLVNAMKAFQNFKTHFCMSCNLISSIESFWINVVSGELRCLNCFKKMALKIGGTDDASLGKYTRKSKIKEETSPDPRCTSMVEVGTKRNSKCESAYRRTNDLKENVKKEEYEEGSGSTKYKPTSKGDGETKRETTNYSRRSSSGGEESQKEKFLEEQKLSRAEKPVRNSDGGHECQRKKFLETGSKKETKRLNKTKMKRKSSLGEEDLGRGGRERNSSAIKQGKVQVRTTKEQFAKQEMTNTSARSIGGSETKGEDGLENHAKVEKKADASPKMRRNSDNTKEEFRFQKVRNFEERTQKEVKQAMHFTGESPQISLPEEDWSFRTDHSAEETTRRSLKHESSDKMKTHRGTRERSDQKTRTDKQFGSKEAYSESGRKSTSSQSESKSQKGAEQARKRKNSGEDFCVHKVHVAPDLIKRDVKQPLGMESSRSLEGRVSKEGEACHRRKLLDFEKASAGHSAGRTNKSSSSTEEYVVFGERSKKEAKQVFDPCERTRAKELSKEKVFERAKAFAEAFRRERKDCSDVPEFDCDWRRKRSHEGGPGREARRQNFVSENEKRKKTEAKEKRPLGKMRKSESPEAPRMLSDGGESRKPEAASKPLKERQNTKTGGATPKEKFKVLGTI